MPERLLRSARNDEGEKRHYEERSDEVISRKDGLHHIVHNDAGGVAEITDSQSPVNLGL